MKKRNMSLGKKIVTFGMLGLFSMGAVAPPQARADMSDEQAMKIVLESNLYAAKVIGIATGVDLSKVPFLGMLFPNKGSVEPVDYERIAADMSRIVDKAFLEQNLFDSRTTLNAVSTGLAGLVKTQTLKDDYLFAYLMKLDDILEKTSDSKYREESAGYYASAAQISLNAMALRAKVNPTQPIRDAIWQNAYKYRKNVEALAKDLKAKEQIKVAERDLGPCVRLAGTTSGYMDKVKGKWIEGFKNRDACESARWMDAGTRTKGTQYLENLAKGWEATQIASQGGDEGVEVYKKLMSDEAQQRFGQLFRVRSYFINSETTERKWPSHGGSICRAARASIYDAAMGGEFSKDGNVQDALARFIGC